MRTITRELHRCIPAKVSPSRSAQRARSEPAVLVNDIHSQLNPTQVREVVRPSSLDELVRAVRQAGRSRRAICVAGARHAMGAQQFGNACTLVDTRDLARVLAFDRESGIVEAEAGIQWPELIERLIKGQQLSDEQWGIAQKQTGADHLCLGGALAANIHGRGLKMRPFVSDVESFTLVDWTGAVQECTREKNPELFRLVAGGHGLFGITYSMKLRLARRQKIQRVVEILRVKDFVPLIKNRIADGFLYGDFQYAIDPASNDFLDLGICSCYRPVPSSTPMRPIRRLSKQHWFELVSLAHTAPDQAFRNYAEYYLSTHGQIYWSDTHQLSTYLDDYHLELDKHLGCRGTEVISELYVPRDALADFMAEVREDFRRNKVQVIYGTIRLIEQDTESFLAWAKQPFACVIFNLHTVHSPSGIAHSAAAFQRLIDMARKRGGSYYLTYHKYARPDQVLACYPQFPEFLRLKEQYDPAGRFQSDWYRHYRRLFS